MTGTQSIEDLELALACCAGDTPVDARARIDLLNDLAWRLSDSDSKRAQALSEEAYAAAQSEAAGPAPYAAGLAYSLRTRGYLHQRSGNHAAGLALLLRAQEMCQSLQLDDGLADALDGIAGIFFQIGDYQAAFDYAYKQLEVAQRSADGPRSANAYNNLAGLYFETGDHAAARASFERNLRYAIDAGDRRIEFLSHVNLAETYMALGDLGSALDHGEQALQTSREAGFDLFGVYALANLGRIHQALGRPEQGAATLRSALALSGRLASKATDLVVLLYLGEALRETGRLDEALPCLLEAERLARAVDGRGELAKVHLQLAAVYEDLGEPATALSHLRQHIEYKDVVAGERSDQRIQVLRIAHDAEITRREAALEERRRLARDLHDSVSQILYSLTLFSRAGREAAEDGDAARLRQAIQDMEEGSLHALREMRLLLYELRPADLAREGLARAVEARLAAVERRGALRIDLQLADVVGLSPGREAELYRIVMEALNNVLKHAAAANLSLRLAREEDTVHLVVADDGVGFDLASVTLGLGLRGMQERVDLLGGKLTIASAPGSGTRVEAVIPFSPEMPA